MSAFRPLVQLIACLLIAGCSGPIATASSAPIPALSTAEETATKATQWALVWSDDFSEPAIDDSKWSFDVDCWGGGNDERQCYTDRPKNVEIVDGKLVITARKETYTGFALPIALRSASANPIALATKPFTSARLSTRGKASWTYGRIEVRARLPQGQGTWPAIWMLPEHNSYGPWASSGEIDIMEAVNLGVTCNTCVGGLEDTVLGTLHFGNEWPDNASASSEWAFPQALDGFHTYSIIWRESEIVWMIDGKIFATKQANDWFTSASNKPNAPFDQPFHLILNLAIGGGLAEGRGSKGVSSTDFPKQMEIDWVKVWQCQSGPSDKQMCPNVGSD